MSYVIYHKETTVMYSKPARSSGCFTDSWKSKGAATRELNAAERSGKITDKEKYAIADKRYFHDNIEKKRTVRNIMTGKEFEEPVNTPGFLSPASESYWTM